MHFLPQWIVVAVELVPFPRPCCYSGNKKYVNPFELPGFLQSLDIKFDLIFTTIDQHSVLKLITHKLLYFSCLY